MAAAPVSGKATRGRHGRISMRQCRQREAHTDQLFQRQPPAQQAPQLACPVVEPTVVQGVPSPIPTVTPCRTGTCPLVVMLSAGVTFV
jgi:hypothetical protein